MEQLLPLLEKYGVWVAVLAIGVYFILKHWWPYWKEKDQQEALDRKEQMGRMLTLQEVSLKEMVDAIRANTHQSEKMAEQMEALTDTTKELASEIRRR